LDTVAAGKYCVILHLSVW